MLLNQVVGYIALGISWPALSPDSGLPGATVVADFSYMLSADRYAPVFCGDGIAVHD
jgi:hypothetical protein